MITTGSKFAMEGVSNGNISQNIFSALIMTFFGKKIRKFFRVGKIRKYDEEVVFFFEKKTFSSFEKLSP